MSSKQSVKDLKNSHSYAFSPILWRRFLFKIKKLPFLRLKKLNLQIGLVHFYKQLIK